MLSFTILDFIVLNLGIIWLGVNSTGESCTVLFIFIFHSYDVLEYRFCGHSMGVIPGLVSIPVVKSFCVLFVYYGFLWEFHFAASFLLLQLLLTLCEDIGRWAVRLGRHGLEMVSSPPKGQLRWDRDPP